MYAKYKWWLIGAGIIVGIVVATALGGFIWLHAGLKPAQPESKAVVSYTVAPGTGAVALADDLEQQNIIKNAKAFTIYVTVTGLRRKLEAGNYDLQPANGARSIAKALSSGRIAQNRILIPEGANIFKIRELAIGKGISGSDFDAAVAANYDFAFLNGRAAGTSLEGYLFPDSYELPKPLTAKTLIDTMLGTFDQKVAKSDLPAAFAAEGLTLNQGLTLASVVEKEVSGTDQAMVAGVFMNRLKAGMPLESDVTVDYAAALTGQTFNTGLNSPYNSYRNKGLPLGPICNPGIAAMTAVAHPKANDYLYFVADKSGRTYYAKTFAEHQHNVDLHLNK